MKLILTCEHGGNKLPKDYLPFFQEATDALDSHRGYDPGALDLFMELKEFASFSCYNDMSRLLVEVNRSVHHRQLFSTFTEKLSGDEKKDILERFYFPYRNKVEEAILRTLSGRKTQRVLHLSLHSFTPVLHGEVRNTDIGLLFDPWRREEKDFCQKLKARLQEENPSLKIRFNYPYLGKADGFTTYLRKRFPENYIGIEVEVNQKFVESDRMDGGIKLAFYRVLSSKLVG